MRSRAGFEPNKGGCHAQSALHPSGGKQPNFIKSRAQGHIRAGKTPISAPRENGNTQVGQVRRVNTEIDNAPHRSPTLNRGLTCPPALLFPKTPKRAEPGP